MNHYTGKPCVPVCQELLKTFRVTTRITIQ